MKHFYSLKISFLLFLLSFSQFIHSQNTYTDLSPKWRLGINTGATWQSSDVKSTAGLAGGFNIDRVLNKRNDAVLGFSLGFRYLSGWTYGADNRKNSNLANNSALNGKTDSTLNYAANPGYFYNNYKSHVADGSLELKMNFPKFEERTHIVFHVFGGLGLTKFKTRIDALDNNGLMYDYSKFNGQQPSIADLKSLSNGSTYETFAQGSNSSGTFVFTPSLGLGLGYRFNKYFAIVFEHKVVFTQTDDLDGVRSSGNSGINGANDIYHYTSGGLLFTLHGSSSTNTASNNTGTNTNVYTNTTTNTQTNPNTYTGTTNNAPKPYITIYNPSGNPYTTTNGTIQVSGNIQHVTSANNISITQHGYAVTNFNFNPNNGAISFTATLSPGPNNFDIIATNTAGQDNNNFTVNYNAPQNPVYNNVPVVYPPQVLISYPSTNYISSANNVNVTASVTNISSNGNVAIAVNGLAVNNFYYNQYNGAISFPATLNQGNNTIIVSAYNTAGNDAKTINVIYQPDQNQNNASNAITTASEPKPIVTFYNPSTSPYTAYTASFNVTARIENVSTASQVNVNANGNNITNFTLNANGYVNFSMNLNAGSNSVTITGTNTAGSDIKTSIVDYKINGFPPLITITNPALTPITTTNASISIDATVQNVHSQSEISVMVNGAPTNFTYNATTQNVNIPLALNLGATAVTISATTTFGSAVKTAAISRVSPEAKPQVTVINPSASPFTTNLNTMQVIAQVLHVANAAEISVTKNNQSINFNYDINTHLVTFSPVLDLGYNTYMIKGFTRTASDSKSLTIEYVKTITQINPVILNDHDNNSNTGGEATDPTKPNSGGVVHTNTNTGTTGGVINTTGNNGGEATDPTKPNSGGVVHTNINTGTTGGEINTVGNNGNAGTDPTKPNSGGVHSNSNVGTTGGTATGMVSDSIKVNTGSGHGNTGGGGNNGGQGGGNNGGQGGGNNNNNPMVTICHKPPGNPGNTQTITIPQSALPAHMAHGDEMGACPPVKQNPDNGNMNNNNGGNSTINTGGRPSNTNTNQEYTPPKNNTQNTFGEPKINTIFNSGPSGRPNNNNTESQPKTTQPIFNNPTPSPRANPPAPVKTEEAQPNNSEQPRSIGRPR